MATWKPQAQHITPVTLLPLARFVIQLLEDLVFFVSDVPNNGQNVLDIMVTKPNRERQKLMREQNILKQVPRAPAGRCWDGAPARSPAGSRRPLARHGVGPGCGSVSAGQVCVPWLRPQRHGEEEREGICGPRRPGSELRIVGPKLML